MKNRKLLLCGLIMFCSLLSASLTSCKKEDVSLETNTASVDNTTEATQVTMLGKTGTTRNNLLFDFTSESSNALTPLCNSANNWCTVQGYASYSIQRSTDHVRSGSYSLRYELRKTDGDVAGSKRSETNRATTCESVVKCERWYGTSYWLPGDYSTDPAAEILTQFHTRSGKGPVLALWTINGQWRIVQFGDYNKSTVIGNYEKDKWTDFVFHVKWSTGSDGLVEIWKNDVKVFSKTGANIYTGLTYGAYFKTGIYKWPWKSTAAATSTTSKRIVYIDEMRVGSSLATYEDVAPGL
jgi:Polysaccharide lyase